MATLYSSRTMAPKNRRRDMGERCATLWTSRRSAAMNWVGVRKHWVTFRIRKPKGIQGVEHESQLAVCHCHFMSFPYIQFKGTFLDLEVSLTRHPPWTGSTCWTKACSCGETPLVSISLCSIKSMLHVYHFPSWIAPKTLIPYLAQQPSSRTRLLPATPRAATSASTAPGAPGTTGPSALPPATWASACGTATWCSGPTAAGSRRWDTGRFFCGGKLGWLGIHGGVIVSTMVMVIVVVVVVVVMVMVMVMMMMMMMMMRMRQCNNDWHTHKHR